MSDSAAVALARAAATVHAAARSHKRASDFHRKQARLLMGEFERIRRECAAAGIAVIITEAPVKEESQCPKS